jgi:hypothetical protein
LSYAASGSILTLILIFLALPNNSPPTPLLI